VSAKLVARLAREAGLTVEQQTDRWGPDGRYNVARCRDAITTLVR
jgi:hypothetical protein